MRDIPEILAAGADVSGEAISAEWGMTRAAVWKRVKALQAEGWPIESRGKRGYRLAENDRLDPVLWQHALQTRALGRGTVCFAQELTSTNTVLKQMGAEGAPHGSLCLCETQTAGRGRLGRAWVSAPGAGLWQSVLLRPDVPPLKAPMLTYCAALAMADALAETAGLSAGIKWPNDLVADGKKLCGILLECSMEPDRVDFVVVGVGLNVLPAAVPEDLRHQAACVADFGAVPKRREILLHYLAALERWTDRLEEKGLAGVRESVRQRCVTLGRTVRVQGAQNFTGVAEDIDADGALVVRCENGRLQRVMAGDVSVRGVMGYV